jgi:hypothetical protein
MDIAKKDSGHIQAAKEIKKFKVQTKKFELEEQIRLMLKDNVINKKECVSFIRQNLHFVEKL